MKKTKLIELLIEKVKTNKKRFGEFEVLDISKELSQKMHGSENSACLNPSCDTGYNNGCINSSCGGGTTNDTCRNHSCNQK